MLNGTFDEAAAQTPLGTTGVRTRRQDYADAGNVAADFMRKNADRGQSTGTRTTGAGAGRYFFEATKGLNRIGERAGTTTRGELVKGYAQSLLNNIRAAQAQEGKSTVYGKVDGMYDDIARLEAILGSDVESDKAYNDLLTIAGRYEDGSTWANWFGDYLPKVSEEDKRKAEVLKNYSEVDTTPFSEEIRNILNQNNVRLLKDKEGGNYQLFGKDWTDYSGNGFDWINLKQGDTYGHGILAGTDGRVFLGNTADINDSHWAKDLFTSVRDRMYNQYNHPVFTRKKFNLNNDYSEENLINEYIRGLESAGYKNPDASYTDVSKLFNGTSKVIAYNPNGTELGTGNFGELVLSPDTQFMWENADGSFSKGTLEEAQQKLGGFTLKGYDTEANEQLGALSDLSNVFEGAEGLSGDTKLSKNDFKKGLLGSATIGILPYSLYRLFANDTIGNKPQTFVDLAVQALKDPQKKLDVPGRILDITGSEFLAQFGTRTQLLETIGRFVNEGAKLSPQDLRWIKNMYYTSEKTRLDSEAKTRKHAEGGILYAADGTALFVNQERPTNNWHEKYDKSAALKKEDADIEKTQQEGYKSAEHYRANKATKLEAVDALRFATMAQDAASIVASFVPGAGTGVAAGLGVTALGTDLVADTLDPAVSAGEVIKNAAINAGFAGLGLIPGAKMGKVAKNIIKYAPKIITAAAGLGIAMDESTQATFKKITDGNTKLNREDWRNLSHVLSLVAAGTRGVKGDIARYKVKKGIVASDNVEIKGITKTDANGKEIPFELPKDKVKAINEKLSKVTDTKNGETTVTARENAIKILTEDPDLGLTPEQAEAILRTPKGIGKAKVGKFSIETSKTTDANKSYDNLRAIWNKEAKDVRNSSKAGRWFANKLGGGDYTAKQRAILESLENNNLLEYTGSHNPMIDWQNLRKTAGTTRMKARYVAPEVKDNGSIIPTNTRLALSEYKPEPAPIERRNPAVEKPYSVKTPQPKITLSKESRKAAMKFAKAFGVEIKSEKDYLRFIQDLKIKNPELYRQVLSRRPVVNPARFIAQAKAEYNFKDGGKVNYQKLRK